MTHKKYKFVSLLLILGTMVMAGCSSTASAADGSGEQAVATETSAVLAQADATQEPVEIAFWYPYGEGSWTGDFLNSKISEFNDVNPNITVVGQSYDSYSAILEALQRASAAGNLPGIATIGYGFDTYIVNSGLAASINDLMGEDAEDYLGGFFPALTSVTTFDGKTYGVPLALSIGEIFYHSDVFEQAGLDPQNPPQTWDEFLGAAETIHDKLGIYGAAFALDDPWTYEVALRSNGGSFLDETGQPALNSEVAVAVLSDWGNGVANGSILYNADFYETMQSFGAQEVGMFAVSSYGTLYYKDAAPLAMAMPWPAAEGMTAQSPAGGNSLYIFGNSDAERQASMAFIEFLTSAEANAEWAENSGYLPTRTDSLAAMQDFISDFANYQIAVDGIDNVVAPTQFGTNTLEADQIIMTAIESVMLGSSDAQTALELANQDLTELLNQ